jgi:hypothetical protein
LTEGFNSSIADLPIFEHSFWKKEQFSGGKDILYRFGVKKQDAKRRFLCYTEK